MNRKPRAILLRISNRRIPTYSYDKIQYVCLNDKHILCILTMYVLQYVAVVVRTGTVLYLDDIIPDTFDDSSVEMSLFRTMNFQDMVSDVWHV